MNRKQPRKTRWRRTIGLVLLCGCSSSATQTDVSLRPVPAANPESGQVRAADSVVLAQATLPEPELGRGDVPTLTRIDAPVRAVQIEPQQNPLRRTAPASAENENNVERLPASSDTPRRFITLPAPPKEPAAPPIANETVRPLPVERAMSAGRRAVLIQADERVRAGCDLANRGALFSAQSKFVEALEVLAQARDGERGENNATTALRAALTALREAEDFSPRSGSNDGPLELRPIVDRHRTTLLKDVPLDELTPVAAISQYESYAEQQFATAIGTDPVGSLALYGLGKAILRTIPAAHGSELVAAGEAVTCYQAALKADPQNYRAVHELATVLANLGMNEQAVELFKRSTTMHATPESWQNLSVLYRRMGQMQLAEQAQRFALAMNPHGSGAKMKVRWVDTQTFVAAAPQAAPKTAAAQAALQTAPLPTPTASPAAAKYSKTILR